MFEISKVGVLCALVSICGKDGNVADKELQANVCHKQWATASTVFLPRFFILVLKEQQSDLGRQLNFFPPPPQN